MTSSANKISLLFVLFSLLGCSITVHKQHKLNAIPSGGRVLLNKKEVCKKTPCKLILQCKLQWDGGSDEIKGYRGVQFHEITVFDKSNNKKQRVNIDACKNRHLNNSDREITVDFEQTYLLPTSKEILKRMIYKNMSEFYTAIEFSYNFSTAGSAATEEVNRNGRTDIKTEIYAGSLGQFYRINKDNQYLGLKYGYGESYIFNRAKRPSKKLRVYLGFLAITWAHYFTSFHSFSDYVIGWTIEVGATHITIAGTKRQYGPGAQLGISFGLRGWFSPLRLFTKYAYFKAGSYYLNNIKLGISYWF